MKVQVLAQIQGIKSDKDFVTYNAVISMLMRPPAKKEVPNYLKKKNYGKVPSYLSENKRQIQKEYDFIASIRNCTQVKYVVTLASLNLTQNWHNSKDNF